MEKAFWLSTWEDNRISFHQEEINHALIKHIDQLALPAGAHIFIPLCGKSQDMLWLCQQGFKVTGVELSSIAVEDFFIENKLDFEKHSEKKFIRYKNDKIEILCGDFFDLDITHVNCFDAIYDRASLIALPPAMRSKYAKHLSSLCTPNVAMLLIAFEGNQESESPPFPVSKTEIGTLFASSFDIVELARVPIIDIPLSMQKRGYTIMVSTTYLLKLRIILNLTP